MSYTLQTEGVPHGRDDDRAEFASDSPAQMPFMVLLTQERCIAFIRAKKIFRSILPSLYNVHPKNQ